MFPVFYLSNNEIFYFNNNKLTSIPCQAVEQYKKNLQEIKQRKDWKTKGAGAQFMGLASQQEDHDPASIFPSDVVITDQQQLIYTARLEQGTAIYAKSLLDLQDAEGLVLRKNDFIVHDMSYDSTNKRLVLSASLPAEYERHLSVLAVDGNRIQYVTEGECQDANPVFDPQNPDQIYYDSCGFAYGQQGNIVIGNKEICLLNLKTGELETLMSHVDYDFFKPQKDSLGNLYFLKRPYRNKRNSSSVIKDLLLAPVKIIKAIIGWLDFFTQRYTGESLKTTSGVNPAKTKQKSEEELFVEGNLIKAQKTLQQNINAGEKYPGMIPSSWELMKRTATGEMVVLKKGVLSYALRDDGIVYSNGKFLVHLGLDQKETMLLEGKLVSKIAC